MKTLKVFVEHCRTRKIFENNFMKKKNKYLDCGSGGLKDEAAYESYKFKHLTNRQDFKIKVSGMGTKGTMVDQP
jgi:hypothetical protein